MTYKWRLEDKYVDLFLRLYMGVGPRDQIQVSRLVQQCLYPQSPLSLHPSEFVIVHNIYRETGWQSALLCQLSR